MLVPKKDADIQKENFKKFKRFSLDLYQKQYHIYENELVLVRQNDKTNPNLLKNIKTRLNTEDAPTAPPKGIKIKITQARETGKTNFLKQFDYNYNHSITLALNPNVDFHLNANLQTKNGYGLYTVSPAFSYHLRHTYYRVGLMWGPQLEYYIMASQRLSAHWSAGLLVSFAEKTRLSKSKVLGTLKYKNHVFYGTFGYQTVLGLKTYPVYNNNTKLFVNPYYGMDHLEGLSAGFSKKISDSSKIKFEFTLTPWIIDFKSIAMLRVHDWIKLFLSYQIQNSNAFVNLGFKLKHFYVGIPILTLDIANRDNLAYLTPIVFGITLLTLFWDKISKKLPFNKKDKKAVKEGALSLEKKLENRQKDLRLISRRVREIFTEENRKEGLVILEAYYGSRIAIEQLLLQSPFDRLKTLAEPDFVTRVIDVTDPLRFYIDSSKLHIPKGTKTELCGFYALDLLENEVASLYIKYTYRGEEKEKFYSEHDAILLP